MSARAELFVRFAGPHLSVQDAGRHGWMRYGVSWSGPLDRLAMQTANVALGNPADAPVVEISPGGLSLECRAGAVTLAVAGGGFIVEHAGKRLGSWVVLTLRAGERLVIRRGPWGSWCCLAFAGALQAGEWLGSQATQTLSGHGGGRIATGQVLEVADAEVRAAREGVFPCPVLARPSAQVRLVLGPQDRFFEPQSIAALLSEPWVLTDAWDRMGVRLSGPVITPTAALDIPSAPIARGSIQVAGDGVPTILLADHQTTGGYPRIATVLDCDIDRLMQLRPRDRIAFEAVSPERAVALARARAAAVSRYLAALAARKG